jgi:hypothetical protein
MDFQPFQTSQGKLKKKILHILELSAKINNSGLVPKSIFKLKSLQPSNENPRRCNNLFSNLP